MADAPSSVPGRKQGQVQESATLEHEPDLSRLHMTDIRTEEQGNSLVYVGNAVTIGAANPDLCRFGNFCEPVLQNLSFGRGLGKAGGYDDARGDTLFCTSFQGDDDLIARDRNDEGVNDLRNVGDPRITPEAEGFIALGMNREYFSPIADFAQVANNCP